MNGAAPARARMLIQLGRHGEALQVLAAHLAVEPQDATALCLTAQAELGRGRPDRAATSARAAVAVDPDSEWAWRLQALALARQNDPWGARECIETAVRLAPSLYQTHVARAQVLQASGNLSGAADAAAKAIELAPNQPDCWTTAGNVDLAWKRLRRARASFTRALSLDPTNATARNNLAVIDLRRRRLGRALHGFLATARADPRSELAVRNLRIVLNYSVIVMTFVVWLASAVARAQIGHLGPDGSGARTVIALAALVPLLAAASGVLYLHRVLAGAFGPLVRGMLRSTWRVGAALVLLGVAVVGMATAAMLPARDVEPMLLVASAAAFGAVWAIPRRLPSSGRPGPAR